MRLIPLLVFLTLAALPAQAAPPLAPGDIPEPLRPWTAWALYGQEAARCPTLADGSRHVCAWPGRLALDLSTDGGGFAQAWQVEAETWLPLPGGPGLWPQEVRINGAPAQVGTRNGRPALRVGPGAHRIEGAFLWERPPESLPVPPETGLIDVRLLGAEIERPEIESDGRLWLRGSKPAEAKEEDRLDLRVFRRVIDEQPMQVVTRIEMDASGRQRELLLPPPFPLAQSGPDPSTEPSAFIPLALEGPLPARLEADGGLRVQLRPGRWALTLTARHPAEVGGLSLPPAQPPWPAEEVWTFDARNALRLVEVQGVATLDPRQTGLPTDWQGFPAYRMAPGETMQLEVKRRGNPDPEPDDLGLTRNLWLDFDGGGYTVRDRIEGTQTRAMRLEAGPQIALGRVDVDGEPQFITRIQEGSPAGVELRRGAIDLTADSRYAGDITTPPATGWLQGFQRVAVTLHLPPGWRLFTAAGMDNAPQTWIQRWTLLDLFLVLIAAIAASRLWGRIWGLVALAGLVLSWHEPGAPQFVWLNLAAAAALLRVLPEGRLRRSALWYRNLALIGLVVIAVPFLVHQVRVGLYPQLERPWQQMDGSVAENSYSDAGAMRSAAPPPMPATVMPPMERAPAPKGRDYSLSGAGEPEPLVQAKAPSQIQQMQRLDPNAAVQTGPGLPNWSWNSIELTWNGPVQPDQVLELRLLPPAAVLALNLLGGVFVIVLGLRFAGLAIPLPGLRTAALLPWLLLPIGAGVLIAPDDAQAEMPPPELITQLRERLLAPPECLPACAELPRLRIEATPDRLVLRMEVHALTDTAVPLPFDPRHWRPAQVSDGDTVRDDLLRDDQGRVWLRLAAGIHPVLLAGPNAGIKRLQIPLPLAPRRVEFTGEGWGIEGIGDNGRPDAQLQLTRAEPETIAGAAGAERNPRGELEPSLLPPFLRVERTLRLDLDWSIETRVTRVSPAGRPVLVRIPLVPGESVLTDGLRVEGHEALINLGPQDSVAIWRSALAQSPAITLTATDRSELAETWRLDAGPIWHVEWSGIPPVHRLTPGQQWLLEWRPWPGESLTVQATRPLGVAGPSLTIERSRLALTPGQRATDGSLELAIRSSKGGQHRILIPEGATLQTVHRDEIAQPVRQQGRELILPIDPGAHNFRIAWQSASGIDTRFQTPEIDLGAPAVNHSVHIDLGEERWVLLTGGPRLGPAVLFWGVLVVILIAAAGLGRIRLTPLRAWHWALLGIGLSQTEVLTALIVIGWLMALGLRERLDVLAITPRRFDLYQVGLGLLTLLALGVLFIAVEQGLLGRPEMQVAGNGSSAWSLEWYQDRVAATPPAAWVITAPLLVYRLLMLAWALWLAAALVGWLRWGWGCYSQGALWRALPIRAPKGKRKILMEEGGAKG